MASAYGAECSTIDLDKGNGSMANIPPLNQHYTNTCYAHAGAVMLDAWLHSHGGDRTKLTSPLATAVFNNGDMMSMGLGNISCAAIDSIDDYGRCEKNGFDDKVWNDFKFFDPISPSQRATDIMKLLGELYVKPPRKRFSSKSNGFSQNRKLRKWKKENKIRAQKIYCSMDSLSLGTFSNVSLESLEDAMASISKETYYKKMIQTLCGNKIEDISDDIPSCNSSKRILHAEDRTPKNFKKKIHEILESDNPQPIGVGYCGNLLYKGKDFRGFKKGVLGFVSLDVLTGSDCGLHESVVIGRKMVNGRCQLKIRNSWGADATYPRWESDNNGNVWVDEETFTQNMGSLTYLE